jgi:hypothetical protein
MDVWIPPNPPTRQYACSKCKHNVHCIRIGESSSYWVMDADDHKKEHDCGYDGAIPNKLLGYKPPKEKKNEPQPGTNSGSQH